MTEKERDRVKTREEVLTLLNTIGDKLEKERDA